MHENLPSRRHRSPQARELTPQAIQPLVDAQGSKWHFHPGKAEEEGLQKMSAPQKAGRIEDIPHPFHGQAIFRPTR